MLASCGSASPRSPGRRRIVELLCLWLFWQERFRYGKRIEDELESMDVLTFVICSFEIGIWFFVPWLCLRSCGRGELTQLEEKDQLSCAGLGARSGVSVVFACSSAE